MAASASRGTAAKPMRRLLRVLELEEEQARRLLEAATGELRQLERARAAALERARRGRALVAASAASGQIHNSILDRIAGLEETRLGQRAATALTPRIAGARGRVEVRHEEFLAKRVERRQVETLVRAAEAREAREAAQREQQMLDDWFLGGKLRARQSGPKQCGEKLEPEAADKTEAESL
jgi:hypothetical protein